MANRSKPIYILFFILAFFFIPLSSIHAACGPVTRMATCVKNCPNNFCCSDSADICPGTNVPPASSFLPVFNQAIPGDFKYTLENSPGDIISNLLPILFTLAGLILFFMLIAGGLQMMTSAGNPKGADAGKARLTSALIGFLVIFVAYWLTQFMEIIFGINIL